MEVFAAGSNVKFTATPGFSNYKFYLRGTTTLLQGSSSNIYQSTGMADGDYVTVVATSNKGCSNTATPFVSGTITVVPSPSGTLTVSPANTICAGTSVTFTATAGTGNNYAFKVGSTVVQNGTGNTYTTTSLSNNNVVSVVVTNPATCSATFNSITMTVNPLPSGTLGITENAGTADDGIICTGTPVTFTAPTGFSNYNFLLNGVSAPGQNGTRVYTTSSLSNGDKVTVAVTNGSGCIGLLNEWDITVNPLPAVAAISGAGPVCVGSSITLSDASSGGVWSSSDVTKATVDANTGEVTGVSAGTVQIIYTYTNGNGCSNSVNADITVNALPVVQAITADFVNMCVTSLSQMSDPTPGGTWSSSNTAVATIDPTGLVTGIAVGTSTISYTVTNSNGCSSAQTINVTVANLPTVQNITTTAPGFEVCTGSTIPLHDATPGGTWSSSNPGVASVSSTGVVTGITSGTTIITYTISTNCGQDASKSQQVTVNGAPSATISYSGSPFCTTSGPVNVTFNGTSGGTFSSTSGLTIDATSGTITPATSTAGTYTVTYSIGAAGGCSLYKNTATVTITALPSQRLLIMAALTSVPVPDL